MAQDRMTNYRGNMFSSNTTIQDSTLEWWSPIPQRRAPKISAQSVREQAFAQIPDRQHNSRLKAMQLLGKEVGAVLDRRLRRPLNYGARRYEKSSGSNSPNPLDSANQQHLDDAEDATRSQELLEDLDFQIEQSRFNDEHVHHQRRKSEVNCLDVDDNASVLEGSYRGQQPYCTGRSLRYRSGILVSYGRPCDCPSSSHPHHSSPIDPRTWRESPAEADWDYDLPNGGHPSRTRKVSFADQPVSEVREFERWYEKEYVKSNRYWCRGRLGRSIDQSMPEDDEADIKALEELEEYGVNVATLEYSETEQSSSSSDDGEGHVKGSWEDSDDESDWENDWESVGSDEECAKDEQRDGQGDEASEDEEDYHSWLRVLRPKKSWPL
ncbi:MAG: hypothetical protein OHK93_007833 [Ramalina farinacea]|uniref:Uncharacterized protein n=1 Tax=Ramalina farinacea TaxID=258253 RepID=A0AA43QPM8_9LECA|nr:hypothetical protein [Ramalina farinacea]